MNRSDYAGGKEKPPIPKKPVAMDQIWIGNGFIETVLKQQIRYSIHIALKHPIRNAWIGDLRGGNGISSIANMHGFTLELTEQEIWDNFELMEPRSAIVNVGVVGNPLNQNAVTVNEFNSNRFNAFRQVNP